jgi:hypothetical protein
LSSFKSDRGKSRFGKGLLGRRFISQGQMTLDVNEVLVYKDRGKSSRIPVAEKKEETMC